jgi:hypothetical protein
MIPACSGVKDSNFTTRIELIEQQQEVGNCCRCERKSFKIKWPVKKSLMKALYNAHR